MTTTNRRTIMKPTLATYLQLQLLPLCLVPVAEQTLAALDARGMAALDEIIPLPPDSPPIEVALWYPDGSTAITVHNAVYVMQLQPYLSPKNASSLRHPSRARR
jgi:hypothetical protein